MPTRVKDIAGLSLIVLFLSKPIIDMFWSQYVTIGPLHVSALHVTGVLVFFYFSFLLLRAAGAAPRYNLLFLLFIIIHIISISVGLFYTTKPNLIKIIDLLLRVLDSYLIFRVAYNAGIKGRYETHYRFLRAVVVGTSVALVINMLAIIFGFGGSRVVERGAESFGRQYGLYYDPGVLALVATFNIIFIAFLYKQLPKGKPLSRLLMIAMVFVSVYMVYISVSRAAVVLLVIFALIYVGLVQKGFQKVTAIAFIALAIIVSSAMFGFEADKFSARFSSEIAVLEGAGSPEPAAAGDRVSFGQFEALGSNRVRQWAITLDTVLQRSAVEIAIGSFFGRYPSHSDYFDVLARNGIIGLFVYVLMLFLFCKRTLFLAISRGISNDDNVIHALAFTLITLYIVYAFPFRPLGYTTTSWYMWGIIGFSFARAQLSAMEARRHAKPEPASHLMPSSPKNGRFRVPTTSSRRG